MQSNEQAITLSQELSPWQRTSRNILLALLGRLNEGGLVIEEPQGNSLQFGNSQSDLQARIKVLHPDFYPRILQGGSIGAGESYVEQLWESPNLTAVIRLFSRNMALMDSIEARFAWLLKPLKWATQWRQRNTKSQAKKNIGAHYDLGNALYERFLDSSMMYSAAIYPTAKATLAEAQAHKLKVICDKLQLSENDHLLEIGTGWGSLAIFAAQHYGCKVTTTTISEEQYAYAKERLEALGLSERINLLKQDYRQLSGQFDKLVSIEMIEAVGKQFLPDFFSQCSKLLKPDGLMLLQSITISDQRYDSYKDDLDFIQKHIFPGGFLPSQLVINQLLKSHTDMNIRDCQDIGLDYARTLNDWHKALLNNRQSLAEVGYDERFMRLWRFYFCYCEGGFRERVISTVQLLFSKPGYRHEIYRC
ncbi:cyclopropane-fatty-acyl-phospholipid synthase [Aliiglaciecola sp. CAU 1673]|uniref:SAM-dependent methyltransferase n=1 Tax=Aliiglaciecola sp. CAU 1673 TaxID=3032595 RepID=UPI0023DC11E4|nr:cyclopropane-fatty-acyl-phospholipid synthase family protein [Aliiglaciecola sp. CAU 1673]MDF2178210.1 cyclopropane-fatty-acyl-phospholipid synthase [Aliiglaciecola sp. CAU 1673]